MPTQSSEFTIAPLTEVGGSTSVEKRRIAGGRKLSTEKTMLAAVEGTHANTGEGAPGWGGVRDSNSFESRKGEKQTSKKKNGEKGKGTG